MDRLNVVLKPARFSPSNINSFYSCPKQWELHHKGIGGIPTNRDFLDLGTCIHESIANYFHVIGDKPTKTQIKRLFITVFEQEWEKYDLNHLRKRAEHIRDNFIAFEQQRVETWKTYRPTLIEKKLSNDTYVCIVDFYSEPERTFIDWKSGNKKDLTNDDLRQGKINEILLKAHNYPVDKILFVALYPNRTFEVPKVGDGFVENERRKMEESIRTGYFPKINKYCDWCDVVLDCQLEEENLWLL